MLTKETIVANEALKDLSEEQISAIATLSENDENTVIGQRFGEVYRQMDSTIEKATGVKREGDEKTYLYLERATKAFAEKYADYDGLKTKIADLESKIANGGSDELKTQLETAKAELASTKEQFNAMKAEFDKAKADHATELNNLRIDDELTRAREGLNFKQGFSEQVMNTLIAQAVANVKAKHPAFEDRNGVKTLIFHDENGAPLNNAENKLNPYTAKELLVKEFESMDILEKPSSKGAGGKQTITSTSVSLAGVSTQVEAGEAIEKMLAQQGIAKTALDYKKKYDELWIENKCDTLPLK